MNSNPIRCGKKIFDLQAEKLYRDACELFYVKNYTEALRLLNMVTSIDTKHTKAYLLIGDIKLLAEGSEQDALVAYDKAIFSNPYSARAFGSKAYVLDILGKYEDALENCKKAFACLTSTDSDRLCSLYDQKISILCSLKKYDDAEKTLHEAEENLSEDNANYLNSCYAQKIIIKKREEQPVSQPVLKLIF